MVEDFYTTDVTRKAEVFDNRQEKKTTLGQRLGRQVNTVSRYLIVPTAIAVAATFFSVAPGGASALTNVREIRISRDEFLHDVERQWTLLGEYGAKLGYDVDELLADASKALDTTKPSEVTEKDIKALVDEEVKYPDK